MNAQDLKNSILQRAIEGKLVPQRKEEGTAKELLAEIRAEKAQLIKEKKIKKSKPLPEITDEEKPFDIPESWEWVRWGDISQSIQYGYNAPAKSSGRIKMVRISDIHDNQVDWKSVPYCDIGDNEISQYILKKNDILFARTGGTVGKSFLVKETPKESIFAGYLIRTRYSEKLSPLYLKYFMESGIYWEQLHNGTIKTAQPNCNGKTLSKMILPLPPLAEQHRIVAKIEELQPDIDAYDKAQTKLQAIEQHFPDAMKKSLLQYAIEGKLVPQRKEEGTAKDLLAKIRAEKARLIKEKKIKKSKPLPAITDDEKPFDIPDSWEWVRLGEVSTYGQKINKIVVENMKPDMWLLDMEDIEKGTGRIIRHKLVKSSVIRGDKTVFHKGDLLYSKLRPYLKKILIAPEDGICTSELVPFQVYQGINPLYAIWWLNSPSVDQKVNAASYGVKMPRVGKETMINLLLPLPPLAEQRRIVAKLEEFLPLCQQLASHP
ncbi:restriction endonuclease subunit S [Mitsuokella multacida]|uniref:restriction endonuclease subunit S n=1 Tax=Mitsuokella multacida TaxID=52226 RepID=UPI00266509ED|nr:restriction endonuclease subunit S [Mitsuokella multacida]